MKAPRFSAAGAAIKGMRCLLPKALRSRLAHWPERGLFGLLCLGSVTLLAAQASDLLSNFLALPVKVVKAGGKVALRGSFRSPWDEQLIVTQATAGCSCSEATVTPMTIAPGARVDCNVTFNSDGRLPGRYEIVVAVLDSMGGYRDLPVRFSVDVIPAD